MLRIARSFSARPLAISPDRTSFVSDAGVGIDLVGMETHVEEIEGKVPVWKAGLCEEHTIHFQCI